MSWTRTPAGSGTADVVLAALHRGPLLDLAVPVSRFGPGSDAVEVLDHAGGEAEAWVDGFRRGALRTIAARDLGDLGALDRADRCVTVRCTVPASVDLGYLQGAWSVVRWCCARGAEVVVDVRALRYRTAAAALAVPPDAPFDLHREVTVVFETGPSAALGGHVLHTRGMRKLARPDVVTVIDPTDVPLATEALWRVARRLVGVPVPEAEEPVPLFLVAPPPDSFVGALHLDNHAVLLVGADGGAPAWSRGG